MADSRLPRLKSREKPQREQEDRGLTPDSEDIPRKQGDRPGDNGRTLVSFRSHPAGHAEEAKESLLVQCLGSIEELNAALGTTLNSCTDDHQGLAKVQHTLMLLCAEVSEIPNEVSFKECKILLVIGLEAQIEALDLQMPHHLGEPIQLIPMGPGARFYWVHTVCLRAERDFWALRSYYKHTRKREVSAIPGQYLNRLADLLVMQARHINSSSVGFHESNTEWKGTLTPKKPLPPLSPGYANPLGQQIAQLRFAT